jgi:hypothetical protein
MAFIASECLKSSGGVHGNHPDFKNDAICPREHICLKKHKDAYGIKEHTASIFI